MSGGTAATATVAGGTAAAGMSAGTAMAIGAVGSTLLSALMAPSQSTPLPTEVPKAPDPVASAADPTDPGVKGNKERDMMVAGAGQYNAANTTLRKQTLGGSPA